MGESNALMFPVSSVKTFPGSSVETFRVNNAVMFPDSNVSKFRDSNVMLLSRLMEESNLSQMSASARILLIMWSFLENTLTALIIQCIVSINQHFSHLPRWPYIGYSTCAQRALSSP